MRRLDGLGTLPAATCLHAFCRQRGSSLRPACFPRCVLGSPPSTRVFPLMCFAGDKWCVYPSYDFTHCLVSGQAPWWVANSWQPDGDNAATGLGVPSCHAHTRPALPGSCMCCAAYQTWCIHASRQPPAIIPTPPTRAHSPNLTFQPPPMQVDAIENITHSMCTLEFESRRASYYWLLEVNKGGRGWLHAAAGPCVRAVLQVPPAMALMCQGTLHAPGGGAQLPPFAASEWQ